MKELPIIVTVPPPLKMPPPDYHLFPAVFPVKVQAITVAVPR